VVGKALSPFMPYLLGGAVVAGIILSGLLYWKSQQYDTLLVDSSAKIERVEANNSTLKDTLSAQTETIGHLLDWSEKDRQKADHRNDQLSRLQTSLDKERQQNDDYKRRWERVALKKPNLLANRINVSTGKRVQFFSATTCRTDCNKNSRRESGGKASREAEPNPPG